MTRRASQRQQQQQQQQQQGPVEEAKPQASVPVVQTPLDRPEFVETLSKTRQMWEFVLLFQFVCFFRRRLLAPNDHFDVDILEEEMLGFSTEYAVLPKIKEGLVKILLDSKARVKDDFNRNVQKIYKQRFAKGRGLDIESPLEQQEDGTFTGDYDELSFEDKVRVLAQLCRWVSVDDNFENMVAKLAEQENLTQDDYRIQPLGYINDCVSYYLFDDNRLYKKTDFPPDLSDVKSEEPTPKKQKKRKNGRRSKVISQDDEDDSPGVPLSEALTREYIPEWECVCYSLESFQQLIEELGQAVKKRKRGGTGSEQELLAQLEHFMPAIEHYYSADRPKNAMSRVRARNKMEAVANRKRSSRLESKRAQEQEEEERRQQEQEQQVEVELHQLSKREQKKLVRARAERVRERRKQVAKQKERVDTGRASRRSLRSREKEEENWVFDCACAVYGENYEDDKPSIQCDECKAWVHQDCMIQNGINGSWSSEDAKKTNPGPKELKPEVNDKDDESNELKPEVHNKVIASTPESKDESNELRPESKDESNQSKPEGSDESNEPKLDINTVTENKHNDDDNGTEAKLEETKEADSAEPKPDVKAEAEVSHEDSAQAANPLDENETFVCDACIAEKERDENERLKRIEREKQQEIERQMREEKERIRLEKRRQRDRERNQRKKQEREESKRRELEEKQRMSQAHPTWAPPNTAGSPYGPGGASSYPQPPPPPPPPPSYAIHGYPSHLPPAPHPPPPPPQLHQYGHHQQQQQQQQQQPAPSQVPSLNGVKQQSPTLTSSPPNGNGNGHGSSTTLPSINNLIQHENSHASGGRHAVNQQGTKPNEEVSSASSVPGSNQPSG